MPRKLIAIAVAVTIAVAGTAAAQGSSVPRQREGDVHAEGAIHAARDGQRNGRAGRRQTRSADGNLHLVFQTFAGNSLNGLATMSISPTGKAGPQVTALSGWQAGQPGLVRAAGRNAGGGLRRHLALERQQRLGNHLERRRRQLVGAGQRQGRRPARVARLRLRHHRRALERHARAHAAAGGPARHPAGPRRRLAELPAHQLGRRLDHRRRGRHRRGHRRGRRGLAVDRAATRSSTCRARRRRSRGAASRARPEPQHAGARRPRHRPGRLRRVHDGRQARAPAPLRRRHGRGRLAQQDPGQGSSAWRPASTGESG